MLLQALAELSKSENILIFSLTLKFAGVRNLLSKQALKKEVFSKRQDIICSFFMVFTAQKDFMIFEKKSTKTDLRSQKFSWGGLRPPDPI